MGRLENKVALISGAAKGQGAFEAALFAKEGAKVVLADIDIDSCESNARHIVESGGEAVGIYLDVTSPASWEDCIKSTIKKYFSKTL